MIHVKNSPRHSRSLRTHWADMASNRTNGIQNESAMCSMGVTWEDLPGLLNPPKSRASATWVSWDTRIETRNGSTVDDGSSHRGRHATDRVKGVYDT